MSVCQLDASIERKQLDGFQFPLGVYPVEPMEPRAGYMVLFEPADGDNEEGDLEEWPDRYVYDIVVPAPRLRALVFALLQLLPQRVYPILDVMGNDAYREMDPFISYDLMGLDRFIHALERYGPFFFEDGLCGFGAMCDDPFVYLFVDEHKIVTVRIREEDREKLDKVLEAFDLREIAEPAGADASSHEHRSVLMVPDDAAPYWGIEEILEELREEWKLVLNVDPERNVDEEGRELGITPWRCIVKPGGAPPGEGKFVEVLLEAPNLNAAEDLARQGAAEAASEPMDQWIDSIVLAAERHTPETFADALQQLGAEMPAGACPELGRVVRAVVHE
ncbi:MAG: hypothetical protein RBS39_03225 [Phycisphaerales bacterium]|jgi:hypothetical protein|nr:hypothetical protein [Phycisphaerales bacterium]